MQVILSGKIVRADLEGIPIGAFDVIRDDVRVISTVKPVDRIYVERTESGYRGVLYSNEKPHLFALNGNGFISKPIAEDDAVFAYCERLQDEERELTMQLDQERADADMVDVNRVMFNRDANLADDAAATHEDGPPASIAVWGPSNADDPIERVPGAYRKMRQGAPSMLLEGKRNEGVCGGGVVVNKEGKVLLVKPRNGYGGYDWTFPKGYPASVDGGYLQRTAVREVREETGYQVFANRLIGRFTHNDGGTCDYFYCDVDNSKQVSKPDPFETEDMKWATLVEALELLNDDVDVKILAQANNLLPQLIIKAGHVGTMVALHLPIDVAKKIALKGGEEPASLHVTLAYLGKGLSEQQKKTAASVVRRFAGSIVDGLKATLGGVGRFSASATSEGRDVIYLSVDSPALTRVRPELVNMLAEAGLTIPETHGFSPHVTLAYIGKDEKTPIERVDPIEIKFDTISLTIANKQMSFPLKLSGHSKTLYEAGRRNYEALKRYMEKHPVERLPIKATGQVQFVRLDKSDADSAPLMVKALPRLDSEQRDAKTKKVGVKPPGAAKKQAGATGKTRYTYPAEQANAKPGQPQQAQQGEPGQSQQAQQGEPGQAQQQMLPHPDTPPPQPDQAPIAAEHPAKPPLDDPRGPDPQQPQQPKHTLNVGELCAALGIQRAVFQQIADRMRKNFGADARKRFVSFMEVHLKDFAQEHGLEGDYFGLLFNVLTGKVQEGQPASMPQDAVAKKPGSVR